MKEMSLPALLAKASHYLFAGLLIYMPFHILLSTWAGTTFNILPAAKIFKDLVLVLAAALVIPAVAEKRLHRQFLKSPIVILGLAFGFLNLLLFLLKPTDLDAALVGLTYNTRFIVFMLLALALVWVGEIKTSYKAARFILTSAAATIVFGLLQYFVLPSDFLTHLGYARENGVLPAFFIDDKPDLPRIMSTLRDPNSFGSYLLIPFSLGLSLAAFKQVKSWYIWALLSGTLACSVLTFSRSAWAGAAIVIGAVVLGSFKQLGAKTKKIYLVGIIATALLALSATALRHTYLFKNVVFHADEQTVLADPNELRLSVWRDSVNKIAKNPLGGGPGTAGLASIKNDQSGTSLNENYYLQVGQETGVLGLALFIGIIFLCFKFLWQQIKKTPDYLALALIASLAALSFTNLLVHIWANEAVAFTWWGLFGIYYARKSRGTRLAKPRLKES